MSLTPALITAFLIVQQSHASPDEIMKPDGPALSGTLISWDRTEVVFRTTQFMSCEDL